MLTSVIFFVIGIGMLIMGANLERKIKKQDVFVKRVKNRLNLVTILFMIALVMAVVRFILDLINGSDLTNTVNSLFFILTFLCFTIYEVLYDSGVVCCKESILYRTVIVDKKNITTFYNEEKDKYYMYIGSKSFKIGKDLYLELN